MGKIKSLLTSAGLFFALLFGLLFKREQSKREQAEKELEVSRQQIQSAEKTAKILKEKRDAQIRNSLDERTVTERMRDKGYLRD